jgi:cytosine/adenosine deaminase-related metal-dependent hydrolase
MTAGRNWFPLTGVVNPSRTAALAVAKKKGPIDPLSGPKLALAGRVVTMDDSFSVKTDAIVYIENGSIVAVQERAQPAPTGFVGVTVMESGGTIFPGLIELHNHLSYNALPPWSPVPKRFENRGQWPNHPAYRPLVSGPMTVLGQYKDAQGKFPLLAPLIRYVECKCLLGGVTTSQGVKLASNAGIQRFYRGIVRNVEQTDDPDLPEAQGRIPDLAAKDAAHFLTRLKAENSCFLLHLSEGVTDPSKPLSEARKHFLSLEIAPNQWALNKTFTGIHAAGLLPEDFDVLASHASSMVWSPLSNLLLYGSTARVEAAKNAGVLIGLGSDWSPTGSKNLLGELKVAWLYNQENLNGLFAAREIVAMATRDAARILKWDKVAGMIKAGARADLLVIDSLAADPYEALLHARETDIRLVMINGVARYGRPEVMTKLSANDQTISVGGQTRRLFLKQETSDPDVAQVSLSRATDALRKALRDIAKLAKETETANLRAPLRRLLDAQTTPVWSLALDEICSCGVELAPRLPFNGPRDFTGPERAPRAVTRAALPLSAILKPVKLDPLTVADDNTFLTLMENQPNVPAPIKNGLRALY